MTPRLPTSRRADDLEALANDERLYRMVSIRSDGTRRRGPVLRALEAAGWLRAAARMADVSDWRCEAHEVFVCDPESATFACESGGGI